MSEPRPTPSSVIECRSRTKPASPSALLDGALPRGLSRIVAAAYLGVSPSTFDRMILDGLMPKPKHIGARRIWDRRQLDLAFDDLPSDGENGDDVWDQVSL